RRRGSARDQRWAWAKARRRRRPGQPAGARRPGPPGAGRFLPPPTSPSTSPLPPPGPHARYAASSRPSFRNLSLGSGCCVGRADFCASPLWPLILLTEQPSTHTDNPERKTGLRLLSVVLGC